MKKILPLFLCLFAAIQQSHAGCNPAFSANVQGATVQLQAAQTGAGIAHYWRINDFPSLFGASASYTFVAPGVYTVTHHVIDSASLCHDSLVQTINVAFAVSCSASFTAAVDSFQSNKYWFHSTSTTSSGVISQYNWTIDGVPSAGGQTISKVLAAGSHTVCLKTISTSGCIDSTCQTVTVTASNACNWDASFTTTPSGPKTFSFSPQPSLDRMRYKWNFGDGVTSYVKSPGHTYVQAGSYQVTLIINDTLTGCFDTSVQQLNVSGSPADSCTLSVAWTANPSNPLQVTFTATSNQVITSQLWRFFRASTISDSLSISTFNPTYTFPDTGYYIICVYISTNTGCTRYTCTGARIGDGANQGGRLTSYPSPATNRVSFDLQMTQPGPIGVTIYNLTGNAVYGTQRQGATGNNRVELPVQQLKPGQYFIDIYYDGKRKRSVFQKI